MQKVDYEKKEEMYSIDELEKLSYYDLMAHLDVPFFTIGGFESIGRLAELCKLENAKKVLVVGCGTGGDAVYIAKTYGCSIIGIDIAEHMIQKAKERVEREELTYLVEFKVGDAYDLEFETETFDVVLTVFVSQFLDREKAFKEFHRVLKKGGCLGINELFKTEDVPLELAEEVDQAEKIFQDLTELPLNIPTPSEWQENFYRTSFSDVYLEKCHEYGSKSNIGKIINDFGGYKKLIKIFGKIIKLALKSKELRKKFGLISKAKRKLLSRKNTKNYVGYILGVAWKK